MKKIVLIIAIGTLAQLFMACNDWLDVNPKSQVKNDILFENENGFKTALMGIYTGMAEPGLYGEKLTMSFLDVMAQYYNINSTYHNFYDISQYDYESTVVKSSVNLIWGGMYKLIMNCNNLLENIDSHPDVFSYENEKLIRGEALALRAYLHFDLLRMFAPSFAVGKDEPAIPYVDKVTHVPFPQLTNAQVGEKILADCQEALKALEVADPYGPAGEKASREDEFLDKRTERMNYYAVKALLARVYLWMGDTEQAKKVSDELLQSAELSVSLVLFNLYSDKVVSYSDDVFNDNLEATEKLLVYQKQRDDFYEVAKYRSYDSRINGWTVLQDGAIESVPGDANPTGVYVVKKYTKLTSKNIPLLRMNEIYYIHAECMGGDAALGDLNTVRAAYDIPESLKLTAQNCVLEDELAKEYRKTFLAEGQFFYFMKRKDWTSIPYTTIENPRKVYCLMIPDSEKEFGNLIK